MDPKKEPFLQRLLGVIKGATYVQKKGKNREQNYSYAQEADFLELVKPLLIEAGIVPIPRFRVIGNEQVKTQADKPANLVTLELELTLKDTLSTESIVIQSVGQGRDPQDKACYKAMTGAMKYALSKAFLVPTGDDPEDGEEEKENPAPKKEKAGEKSGDDEAFIDAVQSIRYKVTPGVFAEVMKQFGAETWPDHLLQLSVPRRREFYKALLERTQK